MLKARFLKMPDYLWPVVMIAAYLMLVRWVLPAFGVPT